MKMKAFLLIGACFIVSILCSLLNASAAVLCVVNGLILYQLWKITERLDKLIELKEKSEQ